MKKVMTKAILMIMAVVLAISFTACGDKKQNDTKGDVMDTLVSTYSLDLKSTNEQAMSTERATKDKLSALKHDFFKDCMMFEGTEYESLTYSDIQAELGVDASCYYFEDGLVEKQCFVWMADGDDTAKLLISFTDGKLYGLGSANIQ